MNPGPRTLGDASLTIGVCKALPPDMRPQTRELASLLVPVHKRREGQATALMHQVCEEADKAHVTLVLFVNPFEEPDLGKSQLAAWYAKRFGFIEIQAEPQLMARMPGATPRILSQASEAVH